ncbi:hypothetical protein L6452_06401 [Arctium lappa]|uniref:Uncharacterized protein n=1 Tax=Arctium lappa TaxID=4217 RepID=A0ACB9EIL3_ARCLA|nr:hypothetical protein L6452_06401 [Arctium lappa]
MEDSTLPTGNMFSMNEIFVNDVVGSSKTVPTEGVEDEDGFRMDSSEAFVGDEEGDDDLNHVGDESDLISQHMQENSDGAKYWVPNVSVESIPKIGPEFQLLNRRALPSALLDCLFRLLRHFHYLVGLNFHRLHQEQQYPTSWTASGKKLGPSVVSVYEKYVVDDTSEEMMTKKRASAFNNEGFYGSNRRVLVKRKRKNVEIFPSI